MGPSLKVGQQQYRCVHFVFVRSVILRYPHVWLCVVYIVDLFYVHVLKKYILFEGIPCSSCTTARSLTKGNLQGGNIKILLKFIKEAGLIRKLKKLA